ncbi:MAG: alpha/beta hydrolase, partial [Burkholderiales bacterium]
MLPPTLRKLFIDGPAGKLETVIDVPVGARRGIALIAHPHPLFGGTLDNKVVQTLAKTFAEIGYVALRPNFRGAGESAGNFDEGRGEIEDMLAVAEFARREFGNLPFLLAG